MVEERNCHYSTIYCFLTLSIEFECKKNSTQIDKNTPKFVHIYAYGETESGEKEYIPVFKPLKLKGQFTKVQGTHIQIR